MSASDFCLKPGKTRGYLLLALASLPAAVVSTTALTLEQLAMAALPLVWFYWYWYRVWQHHKQPLLFSLSDNGELHWTATALPSGRLYRGGLVSQWVLKLNWRSSAGNQQFEKWIFPDQCSAEQYRALARALNQHNWPSQDNLS